MLIGYLVVFRSSKPVHLHPCTRTIHHVSHPSHPTWQTCLPFVGISRLNMPGTSLSMSRALQRELRSFSKVKKNTILPEDATVGLGLLRPFAFTFVVRYLLVMYVVWEGSVTSGVRLHYSERVGAL